MLGRELSLLFEESGISFVGTDREVDITDPAALASFAEKAAAPVRWIVNCAAYTAVDKAEDDAEMCRRLNAEGAGNIAACARGIGAKMIHISTDYVFDGEGILDGETGKPRPYREDDPANPVGVYGRTKREGEVAVLGNNPRSYIIRTAWLYGKHGGNFVQTMLRLMNERDEVKVVNDQWGSPTWAADLSMVIKAMITAAGEPPVGIYHYTGEGAASWYEFAREIYRRGRELGHITRDCVVRPCASWEYPTRARRPGYSVLDKGKIGGVLGLRVPLWEESLGNYLGGSKLGMK
jgi:dTDP-4-dehydrorhamnose reductase